MADGWRITEKLLERIAQTTRERHIAYVPMVVPFELRLSTKRWDDFARLMPPPRMNRHYPEERFGALFGRLGVPSVMLMDALQPYLNEVLPYVGGQLSAAGHQRAAEALYKTLVASGVVSR